MRACTVIAATLLCNCARLTAAASLRAASTLASTPDALLPVQLVQADAVNADTILVQVVLGDSVHVRHNLTRVQRLYTDAPRIVSSDQEQTQTQTAGHAARHTFSVQLEQPEGGWVICTVMPDGELMVLVRNGTQEYTIGHRSRFEATHGSDAVRRLSSADSAYLAEASADDLHGDHTPRALGKSDAAETPAAAGCEARGKPAFVAAQLPGDAQVQLIPGDEPLPVWARKRSARTETLPAPGHRQRDHDGKHGGRDKRSLQTAADPYAFTPNCYTDDARTHETLVSIASDVSFYKAVGSDVARVQAEIEYALAQASQIYELQMNMRLRVQELRMAAASVPASWDDLFRHDGASCPSSMSGGLSALTTWVRTLDTATEQAAHWHKFTNCKDGGGVIGVAYVDALCSYRYNTGISTRTSGLWKTVAHEIGHGFGASHSFENGVGKTGGLMDYGSGYILGTTLYRFRLARRTEMCDGVQGPLDARCPYVRVATSGSSGCGDRVLSSDEQCECMDGSTSCAGCHDCALDDAARECSADTFYMRQPTSAPSDPGTLADASCCTADGKLAAASVTCGDGYCSNGQCVNMCSPYGLSICGAVDQGCRTSCLGSGYCGPSWTTNSGEPITHMPDGTYCTLTSGQDGECASGKCLFSGNANGASTQAPTTAKPTGFPTAFPTTPKPTGFPTTFPTTATPTGFPTKLPTSFPTTARPTTAKPTSRPSNMPTSYPTRRPTAQPTQRPSTA